MQQMLMKPCALFFFSQISAVYQILIKPLCHFFISLILALQKMFIKRIVLFSMFTANLCYVQKACETIVPFSVFTNSSSVENV